MLKWIIDVHSGMKIPVGNLVFGRDIFIFPFVKDIWKNPYFRIGIEEGYYYIISENLVSDDRALDIYMHVINDEPVILKDKKEVEFIQWLQKLSRRKIDYELSEETGKKKSSKKSSSKRAKSKSRSKTKSKK